MARERVTKALREIAETEIPAGVDLWSQVERQLAPTQRARAQGVGGRMPRLGWAGFVVAVLLLFGTVAYAASPTIRSLLGMDPGLEQADLAGLGRELNLSQTKDGITVNVHWAYADANRVAISYSILPEDSRYDGLRTQATNFTLRDAAGQATGDANREYDVVGGFGVVGASDVVDVELAPGESAHVLSFDASSVSQPSDSLTLQASFSVEAFTLPTETDEGAASNETAPKSAQINPEAVVGPFVFEFTVPVVPGLVAEPRQGVQVNDITVTLEKVVASPSETVAVVCMEGLDEAYIGWAPVSEIEAGRRKWQATGVGVSGDDSDGCTTVRYQPPLYDKKGTWQLAVTELVGLDPNSHELIRVGGPWTFEFEME